MARRTCFLVCLPLLFAVGASSLFAAPPFSPERRVGELLDDWHDAAAKADETRYFGHFAPEAVFLGTDASERWNLGEFRAFAHPFFAKGKAWTFVPSSRKVTILPGGRVAWFDELLGSAHYGTCRGSGVARLVEGSWKISHYDLSIPIPNGLADEVVERIRAGEGKAGR